MSRGAEETRTEREKEQPVQMQMSLEHSLRLSREGFCLHRHHDLIQSLPSEVRNCGLFAGVPHGEQHQQLFMWGTVQKHPQTRATVEGSSSDGH